VATDVGGTKEVVQDGVTGLLAPPNDPFAFAQRILWLLSHPKERAEMELRAHEKVQTFFTWDRGADGYTALFNRLLADGRNEDEPADKAVWWSSESFPTRTRLPSPYCQIVTACNQPMNSGHFTVFSTRLRKRLKVKAWDWRLAIHSGSLMTLAVSHIFNKYTNTPSEQAPLIRDYCASGYIDCLHTWGDFSNEPFDRKYAEWAVNEAISQRNAPADLVNHGNKNNTHNLNLGWRITRAPTRNRRRIMSIWPFGRG